MQIDWITLGAQIVNFLILVALLRLFLYKPIIEAMDRREEKIASRLEEAEEKRDQAQAETERYREKQREIDERRDELLDEAQTDAEQRRQELIEQARVEVEEQKNEWQRAIQREKDTFLRDLRAQASDEVFTVVRRAIRDLADAELEQQLMRVFARQIETLDNEQRRDILRDTDQELEIHSAFELSDDQREQLRDLLNDQFENVDVHFRTESDLICGLALVTKSTQVGWNVNDYLQTMQEQVAQTLDESDKARGDSQRSNQGGDERDDEHSAEQNKHRRPEREEG